METLDVVPALVTAMFGVFMTIQAVRYYQPLNTDIPRAWSAGVLMALCVVLYVFARPDLPLVVSSVLGFIFAVWWLWVINDIITKPPTVLCAVLLVFLPGTVLGSALGMPARLLGLAVTLIYVVAWLPRLRVPEGKRPLYALTVSALAAFGLACAGAVGLAP